MKHLFRTLSLASALILPLSALAASLTVQIDGKATVLTDVPADAWYAVDVSAVAEAGIMQGYRDYNGRLTGKFGPANPVTRAEFLKMVAVMMIYRYSFERNVIEPGDHWYAMYLNVVLEKDPELPLVMPIDEISLSQPILREEAAGLLHLSLGNYDSPIVVEGYPSFSDVDLKTPNMKAIAELEFHGVISGDGNTGKFNPFRTLNRAEAAKMLVKTQSGYQTPLGEYTLEKECEAGGGTWKQWGMSPESSCNYPTSDAGKSCTDGDQCEGQCVSREETEDVGTCDQWKHVSGGCYNFVEDGEAQPMICID